MQFWIVQSLNSLAMGGLLFLLSAGFSLIFGLLRIPNLAHGALFMLGAYLGAALLGEGVNFWLAALGSGIAVGLLGVLLEAVLLRRLAGNEQGQVLITLGIAFIIADLCLFAFGGDPIPLGAPRSLRPPVFVGGFAFPGFRLVVLVGAAGMKLGSVDVRSRTSVLTSMPGQTRTRASNVSPSMTRIISAG